MTLLNETQNSHITQLHSVASKQFSPDIIEKYRKHILQAWRIRVVEESLLSLFAESKVSGTVHTCIGQELTGVAISEALSIHDWITSNHRCHGHYIARTGDWKGLIDELLGLESGVSKGIGSSQHLFNKNFISNGTQGSLLPVATGVALYNKLKNKPGISVSFIGEGTLGEGVVYEAFNLASTLSSPQLIVCENNYYSQSTPQSQGVSGSIELRAKAFGLEYFETNTWDLDHLFTTCHTAAQFVSEQSKPALIKIDTYRLKAHSKGDDDRNREEVEGFERLDLLNVLRNNLSFADQFKNISADVQSYVTSRLSNTDVLTYETYKADQLPRKYSNKTAPLKNPKSSMVKALNKAYGESLANGAFFIGEDIADPYGGAYKITKGFSDKYPDRVLSTAISEAGLTGVAIGIDLAGGKCFAEIMFGDFVVNAMDQLINNASKFHHMYGKQFSCSVVIRTPMGGRRGYGPTHSQSLEKFLLGIDNTAVVSVSSLVDPKAAIAAVSDLKCPTIIIENKSDYSTFLFQPKKELNVELIGGAFGSVKIKPNLASPEITVIAHGYLARLLADNYEEIFQQSDTVFEIIAPQLLHPLPLTHFERSLVKSNKVVVLEESTAEYGWADGVVSKLVQHFPGISAITVSSDPVSIPSNKILEAENLISLRDIIVAIKNLGAS